MKKILIIDDNPTFSRWFQRELRVLGYEIHLANGSELALDQFRETEFDLAFFDHDLGYGLNGCQLAEHILQHPEEFKTPKVVWIHTSNFEGAIELQKRFQQASVPCHEEAYDCLLCRSKDSFRSTVEKLLSAV